MHGCHWLIGVGSRHLALTTSLIIVLNHGIFIKLDGKIFVLIETVISRMNES